MGMVHNTCFMKIPGNFKAFYVLKYVKLLHIEFHIYLFYHIFSVLYVSLHRYDNGWFFPAGEDGDFFMAGEGKGLGYNVNIPWNSVRMQAINS